MFLIKYWTLLTKDIYPCEFLEKNKWKYLVPLFGMLFLDFGFQECALFENLKIWEFENSLGVFS